MENVVRGTGGREAGLQQVIFLKREGKLMGQFSVIHCTVSVCRGVFREGVSWVSCRQYTGRPPSASVAREGVAPEAG